MIIEYDIFFASMIRTIPCVVARPKTCVNASRTGVNLTSLAEVTTICTSCPGSKEQMTSIQYSLKGREIQTNILFHLWINCCDHCFNTSLRERETNSSSFLIIYAILWLFQRRLQAFYFH